MKKKGFLLALLFSFSFQLCGCAVTDGIKWVLGRIAGGPIGQGTPPPTGGTPPPGSNVNNANVANANNSNANNSNANNSNANNSNANNSNRRNDVPDTGDDQLGGATTAANVARLKAAVAVTKVRMATLQAVIIKVADLAEKALDKSDGNKCGEHSSALTNAADRVAEQSLLDGKNPEQLVGVLAEMERTIARMGPGELTNVQRDLQKYDAFLAGRFRTIMRQESGKGVGACQALGAEFDYSNDPTVNGQRIAIYFNILKNTCLEANFSPAGTEEVAVILQRAKLLKQCLGGTAR